MRRRHGDEQPDLPHESMRRRPGQDPRRPAVPGADDAARDRLRRVQPGRGGPAAPGDELQARPGADRGAARAAAGRDGGPRHPGRGRRGHLRQDPGLLQLRLPRVARDQLRLPGLRQRLAEVLLPGRVHRRAAARPADGLLLAGQPDRRRAQARRAGARRGRQRQRRPRHPGEAGSPGDPGRGRPGRQPAPAGGSRCRASPRSGSAWPTVRNLGTEPAAAIVAGQPYAGPGGLRPPHRAAGPGAGGAGHGGRVRLLRDAAGARRCGRPGRPPPSGPASCPAPPLGLAAPPLPRDDRGRGDLRRPVGHRDLRHPPRRAHQGTCSPSAA